MTTVNATSTTTTATTTSSTYSPVYSDPSGTTDWNALVDVAVAQKQLPADNIEIKISENDAEIEAYSTMQDNLQSLTDSLETIIGTQDSLTVEDDVFSSREAYLTSNGDVDAANAVVVTAESGADMQTYDLEILQLAKAQKVASDSQSSELDPLGISGTFSLALDGSPDESADIAISDDMSLAEIAEEINKQSDTTGISASIIQISDDEFTLVLNADETGQEIIMTPIVGDDVGQALGLTSSDGSFANELQPAQDAIIMLDGIEITRDSNVIDDVVDGVTFSLYQTTGEGNSISVEVSQSLSEIKASIQGMVDAYNAYREWALTQQEVASGGGASADAVLFGDSTLRSVNSAMADALSTTIDEDSMALLGLSYDNNNFLVLDESALNDALLNDMDAVEDVLMFQMSSSSSDIALLSRNGNMPTELSLDVTVDENGVLTSASVDGDDSLFVIEDQRIIGAEGTPYEGITFVFTGTESQTIDITTSSGIVENLYNAVEPYSNAETGHITNAIISLEEENAQYVEEYNDIMSSVDDYRSDLIELYAGYQAEISAAESSLAYLEALLNPGS